MPARGWGRLVGLLAVGILVAACTSGGPPVSALAKEPVLQPPVDAVEFGRTTQEAQRGWLLGIDSAAVVQVAFAVPMSPEQAARAWVQAYGERYGLEVPRPGSGGQVFGKAGDVGVQLEFGSEPVLIIGEARDYDPVPEGSSVVTVVLDGTAE
jgi:hypothetical protein